MKKKLNNTVLLLGITILMNIFGFYFMVNILLVVTLINYYFFDRYVKYDSTGHEEENTSKAEYFTENEMEQTNIITENETDLTIKKEIAVDSNKTTFISEQKGEFSNNEKEYENSLSQVENDILKKKLRVNVKDAFDVLDEIEKISNRFSDKDTLMRYTINKFIELAELEGLDRLTNIESGFNSIYHRVIPPRYIKQGTEIKELIRPGVINNNNVILRALVKI